MEMLGAEHHGQAWLVAAHCCQALQDPGEPRAVYTATACQLASQWLHSLLCTHA